MNWISVKDDLPEKDMEVLVTDGKTWKIATFCDKYDYAADKLYENVWFIDGYLELSYVTHWINIELPIE